MSPISDYMFLGFSFRPDRVVLSFTLAIKDLHASYVWRRRSMRGEVAKTQNNLKSNEKTGTIQMTIQWNTPAQSNPIKIQ